MIAVKKGRKKEIWFIIHQPFWGAWKIFGWPKGVWGVGLNLEKLKKAKREGVKKVRVFAYSNEYVCSFEKLKNFINKYKPAYMVGKGVILVVVPYTLFKKIKK